MTAFMRILVSSKDTLKKIMVRGEFDEYPDEVNMHCTARMAEMLDEYSKELQSKFHKEITADKFLMDEIRVLLETRGIGLPNFLPKSAFLTLLQKNVKEVSETPFVFVEKLQSSTKRAAQNLMSLIKNKSADRVKEIVEMEKVVDYTFGHLREYPSVVVQQAFDMKMRCTAYWKIVLLRLVDSLALHLVFSVHNLVSRDMEVEIVKDLMNPHNGGVERMLEESPKVTIRREKLNRSIKLLKVSKEEVSKIMDRISADGGPAQV
ncbi:hypothetical protein GIB67_026204 [Kingdonia uniflora]|uniref:GED domain-containing protein n=1 Tax=Kingdonia uniflora TaxID=39325 RepID=A0A7J7L9V8_9MAGN|nr:hypothetical protein GIB67_026204 [Kingdonia uniflora]